MCSARAADVQYRLPSVLRPLRRSGEMGRDRAVPGEARTFDCTLALIRILPSFLPSSSREKRLSAVWAVTSPIARRAQDTADRGGRRISASAYGKERVIFSKSNVCFWHLTDIDADAEHVRS
jgi:hypothetical protein